MRAGCATVPGWPAWVSRDRRLEKAWFEAAQNEDILLRGFWYATG